MTGIPAFNPESDQDVNASSAEQQSTGFDEKDDDVEGGIAPFNPGEQPDEDKPSGKTKTEEKYSMTHEEAKEKLAELSLKKQAAIDEYNEMSRIVDEFVVQAEEAPKGNPNLDYIASQVKRREELAAQIKAQEQHGFIRQTTLVP